MKRKINLRLGLIALVALLLTAVGVTTVYYNLFRQQVGRDLRLTAHLLGQSGEFTRGNAPKLQDPEVRITWVDTDGTVLYDYEAFPTTQTGRKSGRPWIPARGRSSAPRIPSI